MLLPPALADNEPVTPERLEHLLNVLQRWLADTHAPDNAVWAEARKAVPAVRKFLAEHGYEAPQFTARPIRPPVKSALVEISTLDDAKIRIRELEQTVAAFYGEDSGPLPDIDESDDDSLF
jgi:hypothetical protein